LNTVYSIQPTRLNLRIAIAFCIADYKGILRYTKLFIYNPKGLVHIVVITEIPIDDKSS